MVMMREPNIQTATDLQSAVNLYWAWVHFWLARFPLKEKWWASALDCRT